MQLRVVTMWDDKKQQELQFLTNHLLFGATTIARIYKERWQIEIFFKTLKQLLRVKTLRWRQRQCAENPDLDRPDCDPDPEVSEANPASAGLCPIW